VIFDPTLLSSNQCEPTAPVFSLRQLAVLAGGYQEAGYHTATWNAAHMASGVYFARLSVRDELGNVKYNKVNKLILMK